RPDAAAPDRAAALTRVLAVALLAGFLLSPKLWLSARTYPLAPVIDSLALPPPLDALLFGAACLLLVALAERPRPRRLLTAFLVLAAVLALGDQSRWQPWFYQYLAMLGALTLAAWKPDSPRAREAALAVCRLVVAATYFWSGVQKMNATFLSEVYPFL